MRFDEMSDDEHHNGPDEDEEDDDQDEDLPFLDRRVPQEGPVATIRLEGGSAKQVR
jgi:hypothetical protein